MTPEQQKALREPFEPNTIGKLPKSTCRDCSQSARKRCDRHSWVSNCPECKGSHTSATMHIDYVGHAVATDRLLKVDPEWTWEPFSLDPRGLPALDQDSNLWIRLTIGGITRPGVGDGKSMKERIGDAIRNAAMRFGVALDLWAKEDMAPQQTSAEPKEPEARPQLPTEAPPLRQAQARAWNAIKALYPLWKDDELIEETGKVLAERNVTTATASVQDWEWAATGWTDEKGASA